MRYKQRSDAHFCSAHIEDVLTGTEATLWAQISKQLSGVHRGGRRPTPANKDGTEEPPHQKEEKRKIPQRIGVKKKRGPFKTAPPSALINYLHVKYAVHTTFTQQSLSSLPALIVVVSLSRDLRTFLWSAFKISTARSPHMN